MLRKKNALRSVKFFFAYCMDLTSRFHRARPALWVSLTGRSRAKAVPKAFHAQVLAYNMKRVMKILGANSLMKAW